MSNEIMINLDVIAKKYGTDKSSEGHNYTKWYEIYFSKFLNKSFNLLEIGIDNGNSVRMWQEYFKNANIHAIDKMDRIGYKESLKGINCYLGNALDVVFLSEVVSKVEKGFDIVIDDASHNPSHQRLIFEHLFPLMNDGGIYVVEDLQTSYRKKHIRSGRSAVDYFKNLVDEVNFRGKNSLQNFDTIDDDIKRSASEYSMTIESIHFYMGICFIFKRKVNK